MQRFQDLLKEAAQLKQQQLKQQRKNFQALPEYLKSGLNFAKKYSQLRKQHYLVQRNVSDKLKKQGNDHYMLQNYGQGLSRYQQALSVFRYIHATKYQNLKDEDIIYQNYISQGLYEQQHQTHLVALYLNICSALTKMNKKDQAIHSSQQAMKINQNNPKVYYKKAQAYLQYINRQTQDVKVGFYYLNKAYELSGDQSILVQMHRIKKELDQQRQKEKECFRFMFDKNRDIKQLTSQRRNGKQAQQNSNQQLRKQAKITLKPVQKKALNKQSNALSPDLKDFVNDVKASQIDQPKVQRAAQNNLSKDQLRSKRFKQQLDKFREQNQETNQKNISQIQKLQKTKSSLRPYLIIPRDDRWLIKYQQDFIHKHGSKIYSVLQLYNYSQYLIQFKTLLAKCLQLKQAKISAERDENKLLQEKIQMYDKFIEWVQRHPIQKYKRYIERYELQTQWIQDNRGRSLDEVYEEKQSKQKCQRRQLKSDQKAGGNGGKQRAEQFISSVRETTSKTDRNQQSKPNYVKLKAERSMKVSKTEQNSNMRQERQQGRGRTPKQQSRVKQGRKYNTYGFKQQWQCTNEQSRTSNQTDQVPEKLKGFLQNYQDFPDYRQSLGHRKKQRQGNSGHFSEFSPKPKSDIQQNVELVKENPFSLIRTFLVVIVVTLIAKMIF